MSRPIQDEYVVVLADGVPVDRFISNMGNIGTVDRTFSRVINGFSITMPANAAEQLRRNPNVVRVEQNYTVDNDYSPITHYITGWALERINRPDVGNIAVADKYYKRDFSKDGAGVSGYIIDQGYPRNHLDFEGVLVLQGYIPPDTSPGEHISHHGHTTSSVFVGRYSGVAKRASMTWNMAPTANDVIASCEWIVENHPGGPGVVNMSLGFYNDDDSPLQLQIVDDAIQAMIDEGFLFCCSAGNKEYESGTHSPTSVKDAIVCGAVTEWLTKASFSCWGPAVDIWAPGNIIKVATPDSYDSYGTAFGTSYSAPFTAGVAAIIWAENPTWTRQQVEDEVIARSIKDILVNMDPTDNNRLLHLGPQTTGELHSDYIISYIEIFPIVNAVTSSTMSVSAQPIHHTTAILATASATATATSTVAVTGGSGMQTGATMTIESRAETTGGADLRSGGSMSVVGRSSVAGALSMQSYATVSAVEAGGILTYSEAFMGASGYATTTSSLSAFGSSSLYIYIAGSAVGSASLTSQAAVNIEGDKQGAIHVAMDAKAELTASAVIGAETIIISIVDVSKPTVLSENSDVVLAQWQIRKTGIKGKGVTV